MEVSEMMTLKLSAESERKFRDMATQAGLSLEACLELLIRNEDLSLNATDAPHEKLSDQEFEKLLDEISEGLPELPQLPDNFSRADIYFDHD
jgi:hypothetical protein